MKNQFRQPLSRDKWDEIFMNELKNEPTKTFSRQLTKNWKWHSLLTFTCSQSLTKEILEKVWNVFKVNNKNTRTMSLIASVVRWNYSKLTLVFCLISAQKVLLFYIYYISNLPHNIDYWDILECKTDSDTFIKYSKSNMVL